MPVLKLDFEVYCSCGAGLCSNSREGVNRHSQFITVEPCENCLNEKYDEGYMKGYAKREERKNEEI